MVERQKDGLTLRPQLGKGGRDYSVDMVRIISCYMVVLTHVSAIVITRNLADENSFEWNTMLFFRCLTAAPTVIFVMVSGIFFLTPDRNVKTSKLWKKNIPKMVFAYIVWSFIYAVYRIFYEMNPTPPFTIKLLLKQWIVEPSHMWYIPMIIGLYMIVPFLRYISKGADKKMYIYGITLFVIALTINTVFTYPTLPYDEYLILIMKKIPFQQFAQYAVWCLFGYFFYTYRPEIKMRRIIYIFGIISLAVSFIITIQNYHDVGTTLINEKFTITTFGKNVAIFLFITTFFYKRELSPMFKKILVKVSNCTLIVYLMHWLLMMIFYNNKFLFFTGWNLIIIVIIYSILIFIIGTLVSMLFQLIPWKKIKESIFLKKQKIN